MAVLVRLAKTEDRQAWFGLWQDYCEFYGTSVPDAVSEATWERLLNPAQPIMCYLACDGAEVVGFANAVLHLNTWTTKKNLLPGRSVRDAGKTRARGRPFAADFPR